MNLRFALLLVMACFVTYANGVGGAFTYDDKAVIRDNPRIRSSRGVAEIFSTSYFGGPRGTGSTYRPLLLLSYAVQWWIHGKEVVALHIVNIFLHVLATLLMGSLLLRIGLSPPATAATTLLFAVHPVHVEAVTSLVGRGETQAAVFVLLYLHCALSAAGLGTRVWGLRTQESGPQDLGPVRLESGVPRPQSRKMAPRLEALGLALFFYAAAVLTKESGSVAPALAFLLLAFVSEGTLGSRLRAALLRGLPLYVLSGGVLVAVFRLRLWVLGGALRSPGGIFEVENALAPLTFSTRAANACRIFFHYLGRCVFPLHLSGDESAWSIRPLPLFSPLTLAAVLLLLLLASSSLIRLRSRSPLALGFLFFAVAFLPTGNLLFPTGTIFAERLVYLPSVGICLILGTVLFDGLQSFSMASPGRRRALAAIAVLFSARAILRNAVWWNDEALFTNLIATAPASAKAHYDLAYVSADLRRYRQARREYERAIAIYDRYWDAWAGKGRVEKAMGLFAESERSYEKSIAVFPGYENGYFGLGQLREARGDDPGAQRAYRRGLERVPQSLPLAYHLALVSARLRLPQAEADWRRALELGGGLCSVRSDHARWLLRMGKEVDAEKEARQAARRDPRCAEAWRVLAARAGDTGRRLAEFLALEKAYRASNSRQDLAALEQAARENPAYASRLAPRIVR